MSSKLNASNLSSLITQKHKVHIHTHITHHTRLDKTLKNEKTTTMKRERKEPWQKSLIKSWNHE